MKNRKVLYITQAAMIAALYVVLTFIVNAVGLASGVIQIRLSEALCILPVFTTAAIPGLFVGCLLANLLTFAVIWDVIFGSLATLIGALGTWLLKKYIYAAVIPPIVSNMIIVPLVLRYAYHLEDAMWFMVLTVGAGEVISCGILGIMLYFALRKRKTQMSIA